jgi:hypothetical protein
MENFLTCSRDVEKLGNHLGFDISLEKTIEESKLNVKKIGKQRGCIPRYLFWLFDF